jgi:hypothetical protein
VTIHNHEDCYEFCDWQGDVYELYEMLPQYKDKPIRFSLDPENVEASKFYRRMLELGRIRIFSIVFEVNQMNKDNN